MKTKARKEIVAFLTANPGSTLASILAAMSVDAAGVAARVLGKMVKGKKVVKTDDSYTLSV